MEKIKFKLKNKKMNKKADMVSKELIIAIILIVSFVIVLLLYANFNWKPQIDRDVCHESIVYRSSINFGLIEGADYVPLKCQTEKICLGGFLENCENVLGKSSKDNVVTKISVSTREEVLDELANANYDCHSLVGEGKLDFMPHSWGETNYGLICSQIVFSEKTQTVLRENGGDIGYLELYDYMSRKKTPSGTSYLEEIYDIKTSKELNDILMGVFDNVNKGNQKMTLENWKIDSSKKQVIVVQIMPSGTWKSWTSAIVAGVGFAMIPFTGGTSSIVAAGVISLVSVGFIVEGGLGVIRQSPGGEFEYQPPTIYSYEVETLKKLDIYDFTVAP